MIFARIVSLSILTHFSTLLYSQLTTDTTGTHQFSPVNIEGKLTPHDLRRLKPIEGTYIYSGKKSEVIDMTQKNAAITEKYGRQIFSKVPGVFVYDMDGTGNQLNIATRGLDPHRGWELNVRKDGVLTNSDIYAYPASHYNIPMEAVERIELVRGTGSLQYGAQFGGMLSFISKQPDTTKKISFENINTIGSYGLFSTYNSLSGKAGKFRYAAWMNKKTNEGYRNNNKSEFDAQALSLFYDYSERLTFKLEWTKSNYIVQIPGPLTDAMFQSDPRMATRSRNYYQPKIHVPSFSMDWRMSESTQIKLITSAVLGDRNSVLFDRPATIADTVVTATMEYNKRQVDIDNFNSYTTELRMLHSYKIGSKTSSLAAGVQYMNNNTHRRQQGRGTSGSDFDLTLTNPVWGRDLYFKTSNIALFAENRWLLTKRLSVNTGARVEMGTSVMSGTTTYYDETKLGNTIEHSFPLLGISTQYDLSDETNIYAGWSQAYRPVIFKDIIPQSIFEVSDKNLKDAYGYNSELGCRGRWSFLKWDITAFALQYNNRLGTLAQVDTAGNLTIFRTNIGNSRTLGLEFFMQGDFVIGPKTKITLFTSTAYMDGRYQNATVRSDNKNVNIHGNKIESVPDWISRNGVTLKYSVVSLSALYSYVSESFADPLNTRKPSASGAVGLVPAYQLLDLNLAVQLTDKIKILLNANNVLNEQYFTKRPQFYPGPGIWPSDGRTLSAVVAIKI